MAGRIRTIKPELLENARTGKLDDEAWRLFVSMLLLADDYGNLYGDPDRVAGTVFWSGPRRDIRETLARLSRAGLIELYTVQEQPYVSIVGWSEHQRVDKPGKPRVPGPNTGNPTLPRDPRETLAKVPETLAPDIRSGPPTSDLRPPSTQSAHARVDAAELKRQWGQSWATRVLMPDPSSVEAVASLLNAYGDAAGETDPAALVDRAMNAFLRLLASWSFEGAATPQMFVKKWDEIQAVLGGLEPTKRGAPPTGKNGERLYRNYQAPRAAVKETKEVKL